MNFALSTVFTTISVLLIWVFGPIALTPISYFAVQHAFKSEYKERKYAINGVTAQGAAMVASLVLGYVVFAVFPRELLIQLMNQLHSAQVFDLGISRALLEPDKLPAAPAELVRLNVLYWSSVFALTVLLFYIFVNFGTFQRRLQNLLANMIKNKGNGTPLFFVGNLAVIAMNLYLYTDFLVVGDASRLDSFRNQVTVACWLSALGAVHIAVWLAQKRMR